MFRHLLQFVCLRNVLLFSVLCSGQHCAQTALGSKMKSELIVNVRDFGAKGDGTRDDSAAFQKAMDHIAKSKPSLLYIPPGEYRLNQRVTLDLTADGLTIRGEGQGVSNLLCDNPDGGIQIRNQRLHGAITVEHLSFFAMRQNAGTALEISSRMKGGPGHFRNLTVQNIEMRGHGENSTFYFNRGINAHNLWRPLFLNVIFDGVYYPGMKNLKNFHADDSLLYRPDCGIQADKPNKPERNAKTVPCNIEKHFFSQTRVTSYRLSKAAIALLFGFQTAGSKQGRSANISLPSPPAHMF